ncbi:MAG TPA: NYN domain-containing protein [Bryobacteraceae bacterium]|nr:NYN domain-containing protein [Bryobacteraceae bacterium]
MQEKLNIAVFVDYDNIEIGLKSTLRREFDVSLALDALKERGDIVAKFAYANWGRQDGATRQMAENAVQMVQRIPSPRGDKNGADINLALDALEMAFTHTHVNAFAIVSGDSDFIPLVNKLKEYGKTVFVVGGKAFTSTILQQNCHEFISFESLMADVPTPVLLPGEVRVPRSDRGDRPERGPRPERGDRGQDRGRQRPAPLELGQAIPLVERALQVLERRAVQPQLGLLKSTMLQLDPAFNERAYGASSFSDFVEKLKRADLVNVSGAGGRYVIERRTSSTPQVANLKPEDLLPPLRDVLENHRLELEGNCPVEDLAAWFKTEQPHFDVSAYGFQSFVEFLNYAQDKTVVRLEPFEDQGMCVSLGAEFYPPAEPPKPEPEAVHEIEEDEPQPYVEGQPTIFEPNPPPAKPKRAPARKRAAGPKAGGATRRAPRRKKTDGNG